MGAEAPNARALSHWIPAHYASDLFFDIASDFMDSEISHKRGGTGADPQANRTVNGAAPGSVHTHSRDVAAADEDSDDFFGYRYSHFEPLARLAIRQIESRFVIRVPIRAG